MREIGAQSERVLVVCTANQCRSVMAEAFLRRRIGGRTGDVAISSAGFLPGGRPPPDAVRHAMARVGIDVTGHRSRQLDADLLARSTLVVAMTRQHLVDLSLLAPQSWERCFTLAEVVRRGAAAGPRPAGGTLEAWVAAVGAGRTRAGLLALDLADDIVDPIGRRTAAFESARDHLAATTAALGDLICAD